MIAKTWMKILVYIKEAQDQGSNLASQMDILLNLKTAEHFLIKKETLELILVP